MAMYSSSCWLHSSDSIHHTSLMQIIQTSDENEPLTFEVGAGEVMGNKMFQVALSIAKHSTCNSKISATSDRPTGF